MNWPSQPSWKACGRKRQHFGGVIRSPQTPKFAQRLPQLCWARLRQALRKPFHQLHRFPSKMIQNVCVMIHYRSPRVPPEGHSTIINWGLIEEPLSPFWGLIKLLSSHEKLPPTDWLEVVDQHIWIWCCSLQKKRCSQHVQIHWTWA